MRRECTEKGDILHFLRNPGCDNSPVQAEMEDVPLFRLA
jgi:hypothetical protein